MLTPQNTRGQEYQIFPFERKIRLGDDMQWTASDWDDKEWNEKGYTDSIGNFWVRMKIRCDTFSDKFHHAGLQVISLGAYEAFWDGVSLGKSGIVGKDRDSETPGAFVSQLFVPDSLLSHGIHTVAFRVSNYYAPDLGFGSWNLIYLEEYKSSVGRDLRLAAWMFILAGVYLMAAIYYLLLYVLRKREAVGLIFSIMCFLFFGLIIMEYSKFLYAYAYPIHYLRLFIIYLINLTISFLTPYFFIRYFDIPHKKMLVGFILGGLLAISVFFLPGTDLANKYMSLLMWLSSLGIVLYALFLKRKETQIVLAAILLSGAVVFLHNLNFRALLYAYDINLFLSFSLLVLAMMYVLAKRAREQKIAYETSLLLSTRLQNELLKKNIQPHFIMNTLTSLMEWIEESPQQSVRFIEALSGEFEIMSDIAEKKLIPLEQEIALCQKHLEIMRFRKEVDYVFECEGLDMKEEIPPAIFHTLIENGITHSIANENNQVSMLLTYRKTDEEKCYELTSCAQNRKKSFYKEGTGLTYIRSRLEENYGDKWRLESHETKDGWKTSIYLFS